MNDRMKELLTAAASEMEDGRDPFSPAFLAEHDMTLDEVYDLSDLLAIGARLVAWGFAHPQQAAGALTGANMQAALEALERFNAGRVGG